MHSITVILRRFLSTKYRGLIMSNIHRTHYQSEIGWMEIIGTTDAVTAINFVDKPVDACDFVPGVLQDCVRQLSEYFEGSRLAFSVMLDPPGTLFQREVWLALQAVPYGTTITYTQLAKQINRPKAQRAVGSANGRNGISIIVPCHRVIGSDGRLRGYGSGLWRKAWLLNHEKRHLSAAV